MEERQSLSELLKGVQAGDAEAQEQLFRQYEPHVRRLVRVWLRGSALRAHTESVDLCQSIMTNLFLRAELGDLDSPEDLMKLLAVMVRNKVFNTAKYFRADKRNAAHALSMNIDERPIDVADNQSGPSTLIANKELVERARALLSPEECLLVERRHSQSWQQIADELGEDPDTLRMRHKRCLDRVAKVLGLDGT